MLRQSQSREAVFLPQTVNREERTIDVTWTTGAAVLRYSEDGEPFYEKLSTEAGHVRSERLAGGAPLLDSHHKDRLDDQIGVVLTVWFEPGHGFAKVKFRGNPRSLEVFNDVVDGTIRNLSIGYKVYQFERQENRGDIPTLLATDYEPFELSFTPINADPGAQTRALNQCPERNPMKTEVTPPMPQEGSQEQALQERKRVQDIYELCRKTDLGPEVADDLVSRGTDLNEARAVVINKLTSKNSLGNTNLITAGPQDELLTKRSAITQAIEHRLDPTVKLEEPAYRYQGLPLIELARAALELRGEKIALSRRSYIAERAFQTTSEFPTIMAAIASRTLISSYEKALLRQTFTPLVKIANAPDFRELTRIKMSGLPALEEVPEGAEIKAGILGDGTSREAYRIATYGRKVMITRQTLTNDELGAFDDLRSWGSAAARLESQLVWSILIQNPLMGDGKELFHADHKNLATGSELGIDSLAEGEYMMSTQTGARADDFLDLHPAYLIVPSRLKAKALQLVSERYVPNTVSGVNPFDSLKVISEPRLNLLKGSPWFLAADRADGVDLIELAYLDGVRAPLVESQTDFDTSSLQIKAVLDVGAKVIDYRGLFKNPGK